MQLDIISKMSRCKKITTKSCISPGRGQLRARAVGLRGLVEVFAEHVAPVKEKATMWFISLATEKINFDDSAAWERARARMAAAAA